MKTPEKIKDEVAKTYHYENWKALMTDMLVDNKRFNMFRLIENEAMQRAIEDACAEMNTSYSEIVDALILSTKILDERGFQEQAWRNKELLSHHTSFNKDSILNAPSPTFKK